MSKCCCHARIGDKTTRAAMKKWEEEMKPRWDKIGGIVKEAYDRLDAQKLEPITDEDREFIKEMRGRMPHLSIHNSLERRRKVFPL